VSWPSWWLRRAKDPVPLHHALDVLDHDDGVVDHDAMASTIASSDTVLAE